MTCSNISSKEALLYSLIPPRSLCTLATYEALLFRNSTLHKGSSIRVHPIWPWAPPEAVDCTLGALYVLHYLLLSNASFGPRCRPAVSGRSMTRLVMGVRRWTRPMPISVHRLRIGIIYRDRRSKLSDVLGWPVPDYSYWLILATIAESVIEPLFRSLLR